MTEKKIYRRADREMKKIYNSYFPEEQSNDVSVRLYSKQQTEDRYSRGLKFWSEQMAIMASEYEKNKKLKNKYKLMICMRGHAELEARIQYIEAIRHLSVSGSIH